MRGLWFKEKFVAAILSGEKTDTIRTSCSLSLGEVVRLSVGPRPHFALAKILSVEKLVLAELPESRRHSVIECYPDGVPAPLWRIEFRVEKETGIQGHPHR